MDVYPISADDHCWEKFDTYTSRVPGKFKDDCLQIVDIDGQDWWVCAGEKVKAIATGCAALIPDRQMIKRYAEAHPAAYDAAERLKCMDADGVACELLFPQAISFGGGPVVSSTGSPELRLACIRAYNDYLAEEWSGLTPRYVSQCILPMWDVDATVAELRRAHALGHRAIVWTSAPQDFGQLHFNDPGWDPFWAAAQELEMPVCLHIGGASVKTTPWDGYSRMRSLAVTSTNSITSNIQAITNLLFSGILDRFPNLKFASVESGVGWAPYLLETVDHQYEAQRLWDDGMQMRPSEYFRKHVSVMFWFEQSGIELRHMVGVDNMLWEADFPHPTSTYPHSRKAIETSLAKVPTDEAYKMLEGNARRLFKITYDNSILPESVRLVI